MNFDLWMLRERRFAFSHILLLFISEFILFSESFLVIAEKSSKLAVKVVSSA